jgi:hypothetical protein
MRITAKQVHALATLCPEIAADSFSLGITQPKGKSSLRVQDGKVTYKLKADGSFSGKTHRLKTKPVEPQSISVAAELAAAQGLATESES